MEVDRNGLEVLDREECLHLLAQATLGRVAITSGALPRVLPVAFQLDGHRILLRTRRGGTLDVALRGSVVAFEADHLDADAHAGWSVSVTGRASEVLDDIGQSDPWPEAIGPWTSSPDDSLMVITTEVLTGRRIAPGPGRRSQSASRDVPLQARPGRACSPEGEPAAPAHGARLHVVEAVATRLVEARGTTPVIDHPQPEPRRRRPPRPSPRWLGHAEPRC